MSDILVPHFQTALSLYDRAHYSWTLVCLKPLLSLPQVCTTVHNIIVGKLWVDQSGDIVVKEHSTGANSRVKFHPYSYFSRDTPRRVTGGVFDPSGKPRFILDGTWDNSMSFGMSTTSDPNDLKGKDFRQIWLKNATLPESEKIYHFTSLACHLNEPEEGVAPTDSRNRPDQVLNV